MNHVKFTKGKCEVLSLGRNNLTLGLRADQLESSSAGENLGVPVDTKLTMSQQCSLMAKKAISVLASIRNSTSSRLRKVILPLYSALYRRDMDLFEWVQQRATKMVKGLEHRSYEERLRELGLFSLEKRRLRRILLMHINTSWEAAKKGCCGMMRSTPQQSLPPHLMENDTSSRNHRITESYRLEKTFKIIESNPGQLSSTDTSHMTCHIPIVPVGPEVWRKLVPLEVLHTEQPEKQQSLSRGTERRNRKTRIAHRSINYLLISQAWANHPSSTLQIKEMPERWN
ncbi:LOW QUALITY PROTEIN: hypothetical protein QYF61_021125 [Mycteria americana]|uniref:Uncharacterized protein n=1 Tax=Mycteria americana TaxID=33587 RepID=A0AAN7S1I2_MYCAM|nr:LOW QUALITY PROTEIN: hypothetical protein QYF61_021125 [Mycteria americana]